MLQRYADKPQEAFKPEETLPFLEQQNVHFTQAKLDGWCTYIGRDSKKTFNYEYVGKDKSYFFVSRRDKAKGGPTTIPVKSSIIEVVESLNLPDQTMLVGEWMARRTIGECPERLYMIDILWWNDQCYCNKGAWERWNHLNRSLGQLNGDIAYPETAESGFLEFYGRQTKIPYTEGVVIKHKAGLMKGDINGSIKNAMMIKLKYRSGSSGRDIA